MSWLLSKIVKKKKKKRHEDAITYRKVNSTLQKAAQVLITTAIPSQLWLWGKEGTWGLWGGMFLLISLSTPLPEVWASGKFANFPLTSFLCVLLAAAPTHIFGQPLLLSSLRLSPEPGPPLSPLKNPVCNFLEELLSGR